MLRKEMLRDPIVRKVFHLFPDAYLVGGYVRDLLRGIRSDDIDFLVPGDIRGMLPQFPKISSGTIVEFRKAPTVRLVIGKRTVDFTAMTKHLMEDLHERDFTMNAVAWSPTLGIVDPLHGISDIKEERIRAIAEANYKSDPLRMLRTYRFASELGWKIDFSARVMIKKLNTKIVESASERITLELFRLLNHDGHVRALRSAHEDGVLQKLLFNKNNLLLGNIKALSRFGTFLKKIHDRFDIRFTDVVSQGLTYAGLLRLEQLAACCDISKSRLVLSSQIIRRLSATNRYLQYLQKKKNLSTEDLFDQFMKAPWAARDNALLTKKLRIVTYAEKFLNMVPFLSTEKVIEIAGLMPGPSLGTLLNELRKKQFLGILRSEKETVKFLMKIGRVR